MIDSSNATENMTIYNTTDGGIKKAIAETDDTLYLNFGVYSGENNTNIIIDKSISIIGNGSSVVIDGKNQKNNYNIFYITNTGNLTLINVTIKNGYASGGGAIYNNGGSLNIDSCEFINNLATPYIIGTVGVLGGGAIYNDKGNVVINKSNFTNNSVNIEDNRATFGGGAIFNLYGNLTVINCNFINNSADYLGGAIYNWYDWGDSNVTINNCNFSNNSASYGSGAIYNHNQGKINIYNSIFISNTDTTLSIESNTNIYNGYINLTINLKDYQGNYLNNELVKLYLNGINIANLTTVNGVASFLYNVNSNGVYDFTVIFEGANDYKSSSSVINVNIPNKNTALSIESNFNNNYINLTINLVDSQGIYLDNKLLKLYLNGVNIANLTTRHGLATFSYTVNSNNIYDFTTIFEGDSFFNSSNNRTIVSINNFPNNTDNIQKQSTVIAMNDFKGAHNKMITLSATLKSGNTGVNGKLVKFYVNNKFIGQNITNSQGIAIFNYKIISTGSLSAKAVFDENNQDNRYFSSSKTSKLSVPKLSEIQIRNSASIKKRTAKITTTVANLGHDKGTFKLTFKLAKGFSYKKPKVSVGKVSYSKKTRVLTWTISNLKIHKTKSATITWNMKAKKGNYVMTPKLVKNNSIRLLSNNNLKFNVK